MTTLITSVIQSVFRPSIAALSIAAAVAIVSIEHNPNSISKNSISLSELGCSGILKPVCSVRLF